MEKTAPQVTHVSVKHLKSMEVGECRLFFEASNNRSAGAQSQGYCSRAGIKITTAKCFVVIPSCSAMVECVLVTRIA